MKLIQYNGSELVTYEITPFSLNIGTRKLFSSYLRVVMFEDIEIETRSREKKVNKDNFWLACFFIPLSLYFLQRATFVGIADNWHVSAVLGAIGIFFGLKYIFPKTEIHIATNEKVIRLTENRPSKRTVSKFIKALEAAVKPYVKSGAVPKKRFENF